MDQLHQRLEGAKQSGERHAPVLQAVPFRSSHKHAAITTATITTEAGFRELREEWQELQQTSSCDGLFLTWEWLHTWWRHLAEDRTLHIITARHDGRLIALAPLAYRPRRLARLLPFPVLEFLGSGSVGSDYMNFLVRTGYEEPAFRALAGCITEGKLALQLSHVERMSPQMTDFAMQLRQLGWHTHRTTIDFCPYTALAGHTWDTFVASLGSNHRSNFRRRFKKLHALFKVRIEEVIAEEQRGAALAILVALHLQRWRPRGGSDALHRNELIDFHEELTRIALRNGWLRLYVMWLDAVPVAAMYGFTYANVFHFYQSGFDMKYRDYSVGLVMMGLTLKSAIEAGIREFDFLHGEETYKYLWTREERELVRFDFFPPGISGALFSQLMRVRRKIKRLVEQWRPARRGGRHAPEDGSELIRHTAKTRD